MYTSAEKFEGYEYCLCTPLKFGLNIRTEIMQLVEFSVNGIIPKCLKLNCGELTMGIYKNMSQILETDCFIGC